MLTKKSAKRFAPYITAVIIAVGAAWATIAAVKTELRQTAAADVYSAYFEAIILRGHEEVISQLHGNHIVNEKFIEKTLVASKFLLHADVKVIEKVASLQKGSYDEDGKWTRGVYSTCTVHLTKGIQQWYEILLSMREDIGKPGKFSYEEYDAVLCIVWPN